MLTKQNIIRYYIISALFLISILLNCSKNPTDDGDTGGTNSPKVLSVTPPHASPGVTLSVSGFAIDTTQITRYTIYIGGQQSLVISDNSGVVSTISPMFFADTLDTWPTPPTGALDIEIYLDSNLVAVGRNIFTVDSLVHAPGATEQLVQNTIATVESYQTILAALTTKPGYFAQMAFGLSTALDSLIYGSNDSSLSSLLTSLQTSSPEAVAFLDAIYNSSGSVQQSQQIADAMAAIADSLSSGSLKSASIFPEDQALAAMMQLSTLLKLYGDAFIHGAAESASDISFVAGWIGVIANLSPPLLVINRFISITAAATSFMDLIFNKFIVASLPTIIDSLTITLPFDTIATGDSTYARFKIFVRNNPQTITGGDLISQFLAIAGLLVPQTQTVRDAMLETLNFMLGQIRTALSAYHTANPDDGFDPALFDLGSVPLINWDAVITHPRLIELHTTTPHILRIDTAAMDWYSTGNSGTSTITITPADGIDVTLIPVPTFIEYSGSAFGIIDAASTTGSELTQVSVMSNIALEVDFADIISSEGANVLGVRAGTISLAGDTNWTSGLNVTLLVIGGGADPSTGTTDANGLFNSLVSLDPFSDTVIVDVRVTGTFGGFAAAEVMAIVEQTNTQDTIQRIAFTKFLSGGSKSLWTVYPFDTTVWSQR